MDFVNCPICREKSFPVGGTTCESCGWEKGGCVLADDKRGEKELAPAIERLAKDRPSNKQKQYKKQASCVNCGKVRTVIARGIGSCCYYKLKDLPDFETRFPKKVKLGNKPAGLADRDHKLSDDGPVPVELLGSEPVSSPAVAPVASKNTEVMLEISAARDAKLLDRISKMAFEERRSLDQQILFLLERSLEVAV